MARKSTQKMATVVFKVEAELADVLNQLPNKSAFVRQAIAAQLGVCCPLCNGKGHVPRGIRGRYQALLLETRNHPCDSCGEALPFPQDLVVLSPEDRNRLEQFFHGGPLYCNSCYRNSPACGECGWHVGNDQIGDHIRLAHAGTEGQPFKLR